MAETANKSLPFLFNSDLPPTHKQLTALRRTKDICGRTHLGLSSYQICNTVIDKTCQEVPYSKPSRPELGHVCVRMRMCVLMCVYVCVLCLCSCASTKSFSALSPISRLLERSNLHLSAFPACFLKRSFTNTPAGLAALASPLATSGLGQGRPIAQSKDVW